ncbi:lipocalin-like domain-containing protein [Sphingobium xenophagum]
MSKSLRERLIGAWTLVSYVEKPVDGSPTVHPLGEDATGIIMYTPDGFMSAQLMKSGRPEFASGDWFGGSDDEYRQAGNYIAYSGPFQVKEEDQTLTHGMFVSYFPNWLGQTQPRIVRQEGDLLHLSTASPIQSGGKTVMSYLTWTRAGN